MDSMLFNFIKRLHPFTLLEESKLAEVVKGLEQKKIDGNQMLYKQDESFIDHLSIIFEGTVEKYFENEHGERVLKENFSKGDTLGAISIMLNNRKCIRSVRTLEPVILYQLPKEIFESIFEQNEEVANYFYQQFGKRMLKHGYASMLANKHTDTKEAFSEINFNEKLDAVYSKGMCLCDMHNTIQEAAKKMENWEEDYLLVTDESQRVIGIVTDKELRKGVIIQEKNVHVPVWHIMNTNLLQLPGSAFTYEAILNMLRNKSQYLLVRDDETQAVKGIVSLAKLLGAHNQSPFVFLKGIDLEKDAPSLTNKWNKVPLLVRGMLQRGTKPESVNHMVSAISDSITSRVVKMAMANLGKPPAGFVFMALGSEGRKEQTLFTDQDNAIIYEDVPDSLAKEATEYFLALGKQVSDDLHEIGFTYCKGDLMAKNPKWNQSYSTWVKYYDKWITEPFSENVLFSSTFFDCRAIYGEDNLLLNLREFLFNRIHSKGELFFAQLTRTSLNNKPPLTFFRNFQLVEQENKVKALDIKKAMTPIVDFARIYSLKHQISLTNSGERLRRLKERGIITDTAFSELYQAYYFMMRLRMTFQTHLMSQNQPASNLIDLKWLSKIERVTLKEIFKLIEKYQQQLGMAYMGVLSI